MKRDELNITENDDVNNNVKIIMMSETKSG